MATLNIQRGRDHGIASYNEVRAAYGLRPARNFRGISPDSATQDRLAEAYDTVDEVDVWVGGLADPPLRGAMVGETNFAVLSDQFLRLRDGDRFWYQRQLNQELQKLVERQTLSKIIKRNTDVGNELQDNVFISKGFVVPDEPGTVRKPREPRRRPGPPSGGSDDRKPRGKGR